MKKIIGLLCIAIYCIMAFRSYVESKSLTVSAEGSTSMEKVVRILKEVFAEQDSDIYFTYDPTESGAGIQAVLEGRCDIGLSSRNLTEEEVKSGLNAAVLAYDGIVVIVNTKNSLTDMDETTLADIYRGKITNWKELGGHDAEIVCIGRETGSGTRDVFETITKTKGGCAYC